MRNLKKKRDNNTHDTHDHLLSFLGFLLLLVGALAFLTLGSSSTNKLSSWRVSGNMTYRIELPRTVKLSSCIGFLSTSYKILYLWLSFWRFGGKYSFWYRPRWLSQLLWYHFLVISSRSRSLISSEIWLTSSWSRWFCKIYKSIYNDNMVILEIFFNNKFLH